MINVKLISLITNLLSFAIQKASLATMSLLLSFAVPMAHAKGTSTPATLPTNIGSLGGNEALLEKARSLEGQNQVRIVQKRAVSRENRVEFDLLGSLISSGNTYLNVQQMGFMIDYHINPHFSVGARFNDISSSLTDEGVRIYEAAQAKGIDYTIPDIDYPLEAQLLTFTYYPLYGKLNLLDWTVIHFDFYTSLGLGQTVLLSGPSNTANLTFGFGLWLNQHLTSRLELSYDTYEDRLYTGSRRLDNFVATFGLGFLL